MRSGHLGYYKKYCRVRRHPGNGMENDPGHSSTETVRHAWLLNVNTQLSLLVEPRKSAKCTDRVNVVAKVLSAYSDIRAIRLSDLNKDSPRPELILRVALVLLLGVNMVRVYSKKYSGF